MGGRLLGRRNEIFSYEKERTGRVFPDTSMSQIVSLLGLKLTLVLENRKRLDFYIVSWPLQGICATIQPTGAIYEAP